MKRTKKVKKEKSNYLFLLLVSLPAIILVQYALTLKKFHKILISDAEHILFSNLPENTEILKKNQSSFAVIHVGKAGGSTVSKLLRRNCIGASPTLQMMALSLYKKEKNIRAAYSSNRNFIKRQHQVCKKFMHELLNQDREFKRKIQNETEISKRVQDYFHVRKPNLKKYDSFIVVIRHPIDRMVSWFLFQHPKNRGIKPWRNATFFYKCFDQLDDLAVRGLDMNVSPQERTKCQVIAQQCIKGKNIKCEHMFFNYDFYVRDLLQNYPEKKLYIVRTKFFWEDWQRINTLLGGGKIRVVKSRTYHGNGKKGNRTETVNNRTISLQGLQNLCYALTEEIILYKLLIDRAVNLNHNDKEKSLTLLKETCPDS